MCEACICTRGPLQLDKYFAFDHLLRTIWQMFRLIPAGVEAYRPLRPANRGSINGVRKQMRRSLQNRYSFQPITESWLALVLSHSSAFHNFRLRLCKRGLRGRWDDLWLAPPPPKTRLNWFYDGDNMQNCSRWGCQVTWSCDGAARLPVQSGFTTSGPEEEALVTMVRVTWRLPSHAPPERSKVWVHLPG